MGKNVYYNHYNQRMKADGGKPRLSLVPASIITDIARVREYGIKKYKTVNGWKNVELERYIDAFLRHAIAMIDDVESVDEESGLEHYKHAACNLAFICEILAKKQRRIKDRSKKRRRHEKWMQTQNRK